MDVSMHRHALWIARAMARSDLTPLRPEDVEALERVCRPREVDDGTVLVRAGAEIEEIFIVRTGEVHLAIRRPVRGRQIVGIVRPGGVVADIPMLCEQAMPFDALAVGECAVLVLPRKDLVAILQQSPALSLRWATSIATRMEQSQRRLIMLLTKDLHQQVATLLLEERTPRPDGAAVLQLPQRTIAELLGARRQSVSRVLADFKDEELIATGYGETELLDLDRLAERAGTSLDSVECAAAGGDAMTLSERDALTVSSRGLSATGTGTN